MILVIENDPKRRLAIRHELFLKFGLNTCGAAIDEIDGTLSRFRVSAAYIPYAEELCDPIGVCRSFKAKSPEIPLIAAVPKGCEKIDLHPHLYRYGSAGAADRELFDQHLYKRRLLRIPCLHGGKERHLDPAPPLCLCTRAHHR